MTGSLAGGVAYACVPPPCVHAPPPCLSVAVGKGGREIVEILRLGHRVSQTNLGHVSQNTRLCSETLKMVLGRMKWKNHSAGTCYEPGCAVPPPPHPRGSQAREGYGIRILQLQTQLFSGGTRARGLATARDSQWLNVGQSAGLMRVLDSVCNTQPPMENGKQLFPLGFAFVPLPGRGGVSVWGPSAADPKRV